MEHCIKLSEIADILNAEFLGADIVIDGLNLCNRDTKFHNIISFIENEKYMKYVIKNKSVKALLVTEKFYEENTSLLSEYSVIIRNNPEESFYILHNYLFEKTDFYSKYVFEKQIGQECFIHPTALINNGVIIGNNVTIGAYSIINSGTVINDNVYIGCGSIIGSEGFQIISGVSGRINARHVGGVVLENNAHIGDNCAICKSLFESHTRIGGNTQIDNFSQIAHNSNIGNNVVITAGVILCGSITIEDGVWIGVNSSVLNKVTISKNTLVGIGSVVTKDLPCNSVAYGVPAKIKHQNKM